MRKNPRRILSPQRLPFRHPGDWQYKFSERQEFVQYSMRSGDLRPVTQAGGGHGPSKLRVNMCPYGKLFGATVAGDIARLELDLDELRIGRGSYGLRVASEHARSGDAGTDERFFAVGGRWAAHAAFHEGQPGAAGAGTEVRARITSGEVFGADGAHFAELRRVFPDVREGLLAKIAAGQRKLHARVD